MPVFAHHAVRVLLLTLAGTGLAIAPAAADTVDPLGAERIVNGHFDSGLSGWIEEQHSNFTSNWDSAGDATGNIHSGHLRGEGKTGDAPSTHGIVWQCLTVSPGQTYRFRGAMREHFDDEQTLTRGGHYLVRPAGATGCSATGEPLVLLEGGYQDTWEFLQRDFTVPAGVQRVQVMARADHGFTHPDARPFPNESNVVAYDAISLRQFVADLDIDIVAPPTPHVANPLQVIDLQLRLRSENSSTARNVRVTLGHDDHLELVSETCPGTIADLDDGTAHYFSWTGFGDMSGFGSITCDVKARVRPGHTGNVSLRASVISSNDGDAGDNLESHSLHINAAPDMAVELQLAPQMPSAGSLVSAQVTVANLGTKYGLAELSLTVPATLGLESSSCVDFNQSGNVVSGLLLLYPGEQKACTFGLRIAANAPQAPLSVTARTDTPGDYRSSNDVASAQTRLVNLRVNRSFDGADVAPGDGICERTANSNECTLRAAVMEANALGGRRTIEVPWTSAAYQLTATVGDDDQLKGDLDIRRPMIVRGIPAANGDLPLVQAAFEPAFAHRIFSISHGGSQSTIIERLRLAGQNLSPPDTDGGGDGGLLHHGGGELLLRDLELRNGRALLGTGRGGAIFSAGTLSAERLLVTGNQARRGGGLALFRDDFTIDTIVDSEFSGNSTALAAGRNGGGIVADLPEGLLTMNRVTLAGNSSHSGAGLYLTTTLAATMLNSTVSGNDASFAGGGVLAQDSSLTIASSTLVDNAAARSNSSAGLGGGIATDNADVRLFNSILAYNIGASRGSGLFTFPDGGNCYGAVSSQGYNSTSAITQDLQCAITATTGDHFDVAPHLGDLADNGGFGRTHALLSPRNEVDLGDPGCAGFSGGQSLTVDQRGALRPGDGDADGQARCDKGAYEVTDAARISVARQGAGSGTVASTPSGIHCGSTCSGVFTLGTQVTLTASAGSGSRFAGWNGACAGTSGAQCTLQAQGDLEAVALFEPSASTRTLAVSIGGESTGSVDSSPAGIACPGSCEAAFADGSSVTLTATAPPGGVFLGFFGAGCNGTTAPCTLVLSSDRAVNALFDTEQVGLDVSLSGSGTGRVLADPPGIDCPGQCSADYPITAPVTLQAQPAVGSLFTGWSGACSGSGACVLDMDQGPHAVGAAFELAPDVLFRDGFE